MMRLLSLFSFLVIGLTLGCGGGSNARIPLEETPVKGSVTVKGKALAEGEIYFVVSGYAPNIIPIANGEYAGKAKVGSNRIEIRSWKEGPPLSTDPTKQPIKVNTIPSLITIPLNSPQKCNQKVRMTLSLKPLNGV